MRASHRRIRTLLYGDEQLSYGEIDLLHTPALQRLYDLHQLGLTDRIYIDASHSRLHHVVGVMHQAEKLVAAIEKNLRSTYDRTFITSDGKFTSVELADLVNRQKPVIRLIGLLHDLTHAPYRSTIEDEIRLTACKHDEPSRQSEAFYELVCQYLGWLMLEAGIRPADAVATQKARAPRMPGDLARYMFAPLSGAPQSFVEIADAAGALLKDPPKEALAAWQQKEDAREIAELLCQLSNAMRALLYLDVLHADKITTVNCPVSDKYPFEQLIEATLQKAGMTEALDKYEFKPHRDAYMLDVIGNTVCADLLDYAQRDAHFAGIRLGYDSDRIAESFTLVTWDLGKHGRPVAQNDASISSSKPADPFAGKALRTVISLYSHKLRTDIVSELMNLLNVRFYLYERALFHPTKCAAGAMLGAALQLIGWRPLRDDEPLKDYELPKEFRKLGDGVFLHDLTEGTRVALTAIKAGADVDTLVSASRVAQPMGLQCPQTQVAELILRRWDGLPIKDAKADLEAALELLSRLTSRRYFKPVFRNLPNSKNDVLRKSQKDLADKFKDPVTRFKAERSIENAAGLRKGSIVIHCPRFITAQKAANVLLVIPTQDGKSERPTKLREISHLDRDVFKAHEKAILAVEKMYESMWRLVVYVVPEAMAQYPRITECAGKVIFDTMDYDSSYPEEKGWETDRHLAVELDQKYGHLLSVQPGRDSVRTEGAADAGGESHALAVPERAGGLVDERQNGTSTRGVAVHGDSDGQLLHPARRQKWIVTARSVWRAGRNDETPKLVQYYDNELAGLTDEAFEGLLANVKNEYGSVPMNQRPTKVQEFLKTVTRLKSAGAGPLFDATE